MNKAKKKIASLHRYAPLATNPRWLQVFGGDDWQDTHDQLIDLMVDESDVAQSYKRNLYAHLNAARHVAIRECIQIVSSRSTAEAIDELQLMLKAIEQQS